MVSRRIKNINPHRLTVEEFQKLEDLIMSLSNDLSDLRLYYHLITAAWTDEDSTLASDEPFYYSIQNKNEKIQFLLGIFCSRFSFRDIREMSDKAEQIHQLFSRCFD